MCDMRHFRHSRHLSLLSGAGCLRSKPPCFRKVWVSMKFLSAKFGFTPSRKRRKTVQIIRNPQNSHFFWAGGRNFMDKTILWTSGRFWLFLWTESTLIIFALFFRTPCSWQGQRTRLAKNPVCGLPTIEPEARKRHININCFVRLVPVSPDLSQGQTQFVPGTSPVKNWDKPRNSPYSTQWKPDFTGVCPWDKPGLSQGQSRGRQKVYVKKVMCLFRSLEPALLRSDHHHEAAIVNVCRAHGSANYRPRVVCGLYRLQFERVRISA